MSDQIIRQPDGKYAVFSTVSALRSRHLAVCWTWPLCAHLK
jgi:hypothetical protein